MPHLIDYLDALVLMLPVVVHRRFLKYCRGIEAVGQGDRSSILYLGGHTYFVGRRRAYDAADRGGRGGKSRVAVQIALAAAHQVGNAGNIAETAAAITGYRRIQVGDEIGIGVKFLRVGLYGGIDIGL